MLPQLVNDTVCTCRYFYDFGGLVSGHIQDLHSPGRDFYLMIVEMPVPLYGWEFACEVLGDEVLHSDQRSLWIGGFEEQTLKDLIGNALAVVMERAACSSIRHHMRRLNMNVVSDGWTGWFPAHSFLCGNAATSHGNQCKNGQESSSHCNTPP